MRNFIPAVLLATLWGSAARAEQIPNQVPPPTFASRLVAAARSQTTVVTRYDPAYIKIPYPNGDVPLGTGVCTDVIIRAYRELGIDLQAEIHHSGVGSGDTNIDHRRVEVQRKFFAARGKSIPVTAMPQDYKPGDIVTFHLPPGGPSNTHVAIVSDRVSTDGTPLVIHNRGLGVREENWLFAAKITGHYNFE